MTPSVAALRPGNTLTVNASLTAHGSADDFSDGRIWYQSPTFWSMLALSRTTSDAIAHNCSSSNGHPSANYPRVLSGGTVGMAIGQGNKRSLKFTLKAPNTSGWYFSVRAKDKVDDGVTTSNGLSLQVTANAGAIIRSAGAMIKNGLQTLIVTRGSQPAGVTTVIMASTSNLPSVLPGVFAFDIGNNFSNYVLLPEIGFNPLGHAKLGFPVLPVMVGLKAYFQAGYLDKQVPTWPMPVSDVWSTSYVM